MPPRATARAVKPRTQRKQLLLIPDEILAKHAERFPNSFDRETSLAIFALRSLARRISDYVTESLIPYNLNAAKFNYLMVAYMSPAGGVTPNELSTHIHTSNATVTSMIGLLEDDGLIRRRRNKDDARSVIICLTPKGRRLVESIVPWYHDRVVAAMSVLSPAEREQFVELLLRTGEGFEREFESLP